MAKEGFNHGDEWFIMVLSGAEIYGEKYGLIMIYDD